MLPQLEFYIGRPVEKITKKKVYLVGGIEIVLDDEEIDIKSIPENLAFVTVIREEDKFQLVLSDPQNMDDQWRVVLLPGKFKIVDKERKISARDGEVPEHYVPEYPYEREAEGPDEEWYASHESEEKIEPEQEPEPEPPKPKSRAKPKSEQKPKLPKKQSRKKE